MQWNLVHESFNHTEKAFGETLQFPVPLVTTSTYPNIFGLIPNNNTYRQMDFPKTHFYAKEGGATGKVSFHPQVMF